MKETLPAWVAHLRARTALNTVRSYESHVRHFLDWLEQKAVPLTKWLIEDYMTVSLESCVKATANTRLFAIKNFLNWWSIRNEQQNPAKEIKPFPAKHCTPRQRFLTAEERVKVLAVCKPVERDIVELIAHTGLRRHELYQVSTRSINASKTHIIIKGKGDKTRAVPINSTVLDILTRNTLPDGRLKCLLAFPTAHRIYNLCQRLARLAMIPAFGPHALRHEFATALARHGVNLKMISTILGHASIRTTEQVYTHIMPSDTTGATDCLCNAVLSEKGAA